MPDNQKTKRTLFGDLGDFQLLTVFKGLLCSIPNLLIYAIVGILIIGFDQGNVIPLDMFENDQFYSLSLNIGIFNFQLYFLALIMSLYPNYIYNMLFENGGVDDKDEEDIWHNEKLGLIYYGTPYETYVEKDKLKDKTTTSLENPYSGKELKMWKLSFLESAVRRFLGFFLFVLWGSLVIYTFTAHQIREGENNIALAVGVIGVLVTLYLFWAIVVKMRRRIVDQEVFEKYKAIATVIYRLRFVYFIVLFSLFIGSVYWLGWCLATVLIQFFVCLQLAIYLLLFRTFRKLIDSQGHIVSLLSSIRNMGLLVFVFLLCVNVFPELATALNPVNIVLAGLITLYTFLIMMLKIYLYLRSQRSDYRMFGIFPRYLIYIFIVLIFGFFGFNLYQGNNLHQLQLVEKSSPVDIGDFYNAFHDQIGDMRNGPILYAAYGGGLKAHYWNYLLLDKIEKEGCLNNILAMSGVSGGGMGLSNFTAMKYYGLDSLKRDKLMNEVKGANILGLELAWLFGWDLLREMFPASIIGGYDRSNRSMNYYQQRLFSHTDSKNNLVDSVTFDGVYSSIFKDGYYPNVIINSTATTNKSGIVSAIRTPRMFPGTINLLDHERDPNKTLTFLEAASTCNRFPIISPAANVVGKGHFVDGGYYENSGVMSLLSFKKALEFHENTLRQDSLIDIDQSIFNDTIQLVSVRNDKVNYIHSLLEKLKVMDNNIPLYLECNDDFTEIGAVVSSITNLERTPTYLRDLIETYYDDDYNMVYIDLPYYIYEEDIESFFGGTPNDKLKASLQLLIDESNTEITNLLRDASPRYELKNWGVINPPTARILSRPVEIYMKEMMKHSSVTTQLEMLFEFKKAKE